MHLVLQVINQVLLLCVLLRIVASAYIEYSTNPTDNSFEKLARTVTFAIILQATFTILNKTLG